MKIKIIALSLFLSAGISIFSSQPQEPAPTQPTSDSSSSTDAPDQNDDYPFDPPMFIPHIIFQHTNLP